MSVHPYEDLSLIAQERAAEKAEFCLATGVTPSEYDGLTQVEIAAFVKESNKRAERANRGRT